MEFESNSSSSVTPAPSGWRSNDSFRGGPRPPVQRRINRSRSSFQHRIGGRCPPLNEAQDAEYLADVFKVTGEIVREKNLVDYQVVTNGPGYQSVSYLHFHLTGR